MLDQKQLDIVGKRIAPLKLIVVALVMAVAIFAVVVIVMNGGVSFPQPFSVLSIVGLVGAGMMVPMSIVMPLAVRRQSASQFNAKDYQGDRFLKDTLPGLLSLWVSSTIIGCAMLESAAFLNLVVAIIDKQGINTIVAFVMLAFMMMFFPSVNRVAAWIDNQMADAKRSGN